LGKAADAVRFRVECLLESAITGAMDRDTALWLRDITVRNAELRANLAAVGLVDPLEPQSKGQTMAEFLDDFVLRNAPTKKPSTVAVWRQVVQMLKTYMPAGIQLADVTTGHAKAFLAKLQARVKEGTMRPTTVHNRIGFARQFFQDAVDWEHIPKNPFASRAIKTSVPSTKSNVEVPRETIEAILEHCDPTWAAIVGLSLYGGLRTPSETLSLKWGDIDFENRRMSIPEPKVEHHEGRGVRCCPMFPELAPLLEKLFAEATQTLGHHPSREDYVIGKDAYRKAAMRTGGWANSNLRTQFLKLLRRAGVAPWPRLFHSMRATRQTELECSFPLHVVCSWLGNTESIARKSYLLLTESDFEKAIQSQKLPDAKADAPAVLEESKTLEICDAKGEAAGSRTEPHQSEKTQQNTRVFIDFPSENSRFSAEGTGPWTLISDLGVDATRSMRESGNRDHPRRGLRRPYGEKPIAFMDQGVLGCGESDFGLLCSF
jgi:integrase